MLQRIFTNTADIIMFLIDSKNDFYKLRLNSVPNICLILLFSEAVLCHSKPREDKWLRRDEIRLPNGTVVGKYMYYDKEGAAVNVKYYADDDGYGVELKSLKMSGIKPEENISPNKHIRVITPDPEPNGYEPVDSNTLNENEGFETPTNELNESTNTITDTGNLVDDTLEKGMKKNKNYYQTQFGTTPEYDIFIEKKTPGIRNKKAKVYLNQNERNRRSLMNSIKKFRFHDMEYQE